MKKLSYKKPLVEVMDFDVTDILTGSTDGISIVSFSDDATTNKATDYLSINNGVISVN